MLRGRWALVLVLACGVSCGRVAVAKTPVTALEARVTDLAGVIPPDARARLEQQLAAFERETAHQVAVLTVPALDGEPIEELALRVFEEWKLGRVGADDGILLIVAPNDRRVRIEVGYGLEGAVPDVLAGRIVRDQMTPRFRSGDVAGGIENGVTALLAAARGERMPAPAYAAASSRVRGDPLGIVLFVSLFSGMLGAPLRRLRALRPVASLIGGGFAAVVTWFVLGTALWSVVASVLGAFFGWIGPGANGLRRGIGHGGWSRGGFGGGFAGGGGRSGGGGASGSW